MPSPDFSEYIDLTVNDLQPEDIYTAAVEYAQTGLPEFSPRSGTIEDAILQSMSYVSGEVIGAINRLPNGLMEGILRLMGFNRLEDTFAIGAVVFTSIDDTGLAIPVGTQVAYTEITATGSIQHIFETTEAAQISLGSTTSSPVAVVAVETGEKPAISDGQSMVILTASNKLFSAAFSGSLTQGAVGESDADYFQRGVRYLQSLSTALATPAQISSYVLDNFQEAYRTTTLDLTEIDSLTGITIFESGGLIGASLTPNITSVAPVINPGDHMRIYGATPEYFNGIFEIDSVEPYPGSAIYFSNTVGASSGETHTGTYTVELLEGLKLTTDDVLGSITIIVNGTEAQDISSAYRNTIKSGVGQKIIGGISLSVVNALFLDFDVNIVFGLQSGFSELDVRNAIDTRISTYLSAEEWDWSSKIRLTTLTTLISEINGVEYVDSVSAALAAGEPLAQQLLNGDIEFLYKGVLPRANVTVGVV
jgi:hypothetical protein